MARFIAQDNTAEGLISFYNLMFADMGITLPKHLEPVAYALMDPRIKKLMLIAPPGTGKSLLLSVAYPAHRLGLNPAELIIAISAGEQLVQGFMLAAGRFIETEKYRALFPRTQPNKIEGWSSEKGLFVTGHPPGIRDASYFSCGVDSATLTGVHGTVLIMDDIHNAMNSTTSDQCEKVVARYYNTILGRADPRGCRFIIAGRRWHQNDIYGELSKSNAYVVITLPAERMGTDKLWCDVEIPEGLKCCFNE